MFQIPTTLLVISRLKLQNDFHSILAKSLIKDVVLMNCSDLKLGGIITNKHFTVNRIPFLAVFKVVDSSNKMLQNPVPPTIVNVLHQGLHEKPHSANNVLKCLWKYGHDFHSIFRINAITLKHCPVFHHINANRVCNNLFTFNIQSKSHVRKLDKFCCID